MNKTLFFLIFLCNISFAQTKLEGNLASFPSTQYSIIIDQSSLNEYKGKSVGEGTTDNKGQFNIKIDIKTENPISLFIGNLFFSLWAKPNSTMSILENVNSHYTFSGATIIENTILFKSGLMQPYKVAKNIGLDNFNPNKQIAYLDSIENGRLQILKTIDNDNKASQKFRSYYKTEVFSFTHFNKNQYPAFLKASNKITDKDIQKDYFNFWNKFKLENDSTASNSYQNALGNFIEYKALEKDSNNKAGSEQAWHEIFRTADSILQEYPISLQKQKTDYLLLLIKYFNFSNLTANEIDIYRRQFPLSSSILIIEDLWHKKQGIESTIPSFQLKNIDEELVDIKDFRGKVIYIDFWGSWCKACLINMPHAEQLKQKLKDEDVAFLYINFYDTNEKWTTAIKKYNIEGTHLKAEKSDEEYFNSKFNINQGFPRYALIDKKGKLITVSAPQPQDKSAYDLIQKYLNE